MYVDEYQDTDPAQEQLLHRLAGDGRLLVAVGDPDQSIYGFRGADVRGILEFPDRFPRLDGSPAAGAGARHLPAQRRGAARRCRGPSRPGSRSAGCRGEPPTTAHWSRPVRPVAAAPEIQLYSTVTAEVAAIADLLRRAHLEDGMPWSQMAVLVRSGIRSIAVLRRALVSAGVPVSVAADEIPLSRDPAVAPLLAALRYVAIRTSKSATRRAEPSCRIEDARMLLLSPLGGASPAQLRALGRRLRALVRARRRPTAGAVVGPDPRCRDRAPSTC